MSGPEKIKTILSGFQKIRILKESARTNTELEHILNRALPTDLRGHVAVSNVRDNKLILLVNGPIAATRARFILPELLKKMKKSAPSSEISTIRLRVKRQISTTD